MYFLLNMSISEIWSSCFAVFYMSSVVLTEHYFLLLYPPPPHRCHVGDLVYSVLPPISWTSSPPDSLSSPCSRDGSSHTEQFPISFVHAGSSKHLVQVLLTALPAVALNFVLVVVSSKQCSDRMHPRVCRFSFSSPPLFTFLYPFLVLCLTTSSVCPLVSGVDMLKWFIALHQH